MMRKVSKLTLATPGPEAKPASHHFKPFVALTYADTYNPWAVCRPEYHDVILVTYGHAAAFARRLTANMTPEQRKYYIDRRRPCKRTDGRAFEIHLKELNGSVSGGKIWLRNAKGHSVTIHDVKGFFGLNFSQIARLYGTEDLAEIMERTRASLAAVDIKPYHQDWYRCTSIAQELWLKLDINVFSNFGYSAPHDEPGNLQGYNVFGHTDERIYAYDINSAYLSVMAEIPAFQPFTDRMWKARQELVQANDPAAHVLKMAATVMPGKFDSRKGVNRYYRPYFAKYIRYRVNERLRKAMRAADHIEEGPNDHNVYRYCVDGFLARTDISHLLNIGTDLGQWKPVKVHNGLTIARSSVWYTDREGKTGGFNVTRQQIDQCATDPYEVHTTRTAFNWYLLEERTEEVNLRQPHNDLTCRKCWDEEAPLHDLFGMYI